MIATRQCAWLAVLAAVCGCAAAPDPRAVLVQLNVPYTTESFVTQAGAGDVVAVTAFLDAGMTANAKDSEGRFALINAAAGGHDAVVTLLLGAAARVNVASATGMTPLAAAIYNDQPSTIAILLAKGASVTARTVDRQPLLLAIRAGRVEAVTQLLAKGAQPFVQDHQWSALMMAAFLGDIGIVNALLAKDSNINSANDDGVTALMYAASAGHTPVVQALLSKGAAVNARDRAGLTALMLAANNGHALAVRVLIAGGADAAMRNATGGTARTLTAANGHSEIAALLPAPAAPPPPAPRGTTLVEAERAATRSAANWRQLEHRNFMTRDDRRLFEGAARTAWAYVARQYQPSTGLIDATSGYPYATVWDMASGLAALYAGHALQFLGDAEYDRRMRRALATLQTMPLVDHAAFNKVYSTRTAAMIGRDRTTSVRGYGWSTTDIGRLLVWLKIIAASDPAHAETVTAIVKRLDFSKLVADGYLWGQDFDNAGKARRYQEGQIGYEQYAAIGFAAWGADVGRALRLTDNGLPVTVMRRTLYADARGHDRLTSDPLVLTGLEVGWDMPTEQFARDLLGVQEARYRTTGRVVMLGEDAIDRAPHFFYYYGAYSHRQTFAVDVQAPGAFVDEPRWVSAKAAYGWHALLPRPYTRLAMQSVAPARTAAGWASGVFEGTGGSAGALNINTAAVILTAALVARSGEPVLRPAAEGSP